MEWVRRAVVQEDAGWGDHSRPRQRCQTFLKCPGKQQTGFKPGTRVTKLCPHFRALDVWVSWALGPELPPWEKHSVSPSSYLLLPSAFQMCRFLIFCLEVKDQGRIVLRNSPVLILASVKYELMTRITFQNFLSALEIRGELSKCSLPRKSLV